MSEINFKPVFDYIDERVKEVRHDMATKADIERVLNAIDKFAKRDGVNEGEIKAVGNRVDKVDAWITEAASKVGVVYRQ